jgi:branched-chain amino acid transport system permease protein
MDYFFSVFTVVCVNLIGILSIYVVTGLNGMFSIGQASFMLIGAYTAGMVSVNLKLPMGVGVIAGIVVGALFALILGIPTVKLRKDYVALITFGFGEAIVALLNNLVSITGGAQGLSNISKKTTPWIAFLTLILMIFLVYNFQKSKYGRQSLAQKSDPLAAAAMGINVNRIKLISFVFGGAIAALAGTLYVHFTTYVEPVGFGWQKSAEWLIMVFVGGINSLIGVLFTGALLTALPEILRFAGLWRIVFYSVIVLTIVNFRPQGIFGSYEINFKHIYFRIKSFIQTFINRIIAKKGGII